MFEGIVFNTALSALLGGQRQREVNASDANKKLAEQGPLKKLNPSRPPAVTRHSGVGQALALQDSGNRTTHSTARNADSEPYRTALMKSFGRFS